MTEFNPQSAVIVSDSLSGLKVLESLQSGCRQDLVLEVLHLLNMAFWRGMVIDLCWISSNVGIGGNEACNQAAKRALSFDCATPISLGPSELSNLSKVNITNKWQSQWVNYTKGRSCFKVHPEVTSSVSFPRLSHWD